MKVPTHCPTCKDVLLNDFVQGKRGNSLHFKECSTRIDHKFKCRVSNDGKEVLSMTVSISIMPWQQVVWDFTDKKVMVTKLKYEDLVKNMISGIAPETIPWFEPDTSDMNHLIQKVKTYIIFL